jgi:hypothetical protein
VRTTRAFEILKAIKAHFDEGADCVYRDGLILSDESTLHEAIKDCLQEEETIPWIPRRLRKKIGKNYYGDWNGFEGKTKVKEFGKDQEAAHKWLHEND